MSPKQNPLRIALCVLALSASASGAAQATEGYFVEGAGARDQALAGADARFEHQHLDVAA